MPRDSNGSYSLPNAPFVAGTASDATKVNSNFADIAAELSDSYSRSAKGGLLAPLKMQDGTLAAPGITFVNEGSSGFYRVGANILAWVIAGVERVRATVTGAKVTGTLEATGASTLTGGWTTGAAGPATAGDGRLQRSGDAGQGVVHFGAGNTHYLWWNGTRFVLGDGPDALSVGTPIAGTDAAQARCAFLVAGRMNGSTGAISSQTGSITATAGSNGTGFTTAVVPGLTTSGLVVASISATSGAFMVVCDLSTVGQVKFLTYSNTFTLINCDVSFAVLKL
jgi:hypothetical protein